MTSRKRGRFAASLAKRAAMVAVAALGLYQCAAFFRYGGTAPFFSYDDSLGNVAFSLAETGRYGFLSSPLLGDHGVRADGFFNYGPFYFMLGAALSWLFGPSVMVLRAIHPGMIVMITILSLGWFGRRSIAVAVVLAIGAWTMFKLGQWPMIRPDPLVSALALTGVVAAGRAISRNCAASWGVAGALCCAALLTHPVAWPLAPGLIVVWLIWGVERLASRGGAAVSGLLLAGCAAGVGALLPVLLSLAAIGSNLPVFLAFVGAYNDSMENMGPGFLVNAGTHFLATWGAVSRVWWLGGILAVGLLTAGGLLLAIPRLTLARRRQVLSLVLPPMSLWLAYELGMANLPKYHSGYTIFSQLGALWAACSGLAALPLVLRGRSGFGLRRLIGPAALVVAVIGDLSVAGVAGPWESAADLGPPFARLQAEIDAQLPSRATIWGPALLGMRAGSRTDLVATEQALELLNSLPQAARIEVLPQFLMMSGEDFYSWATHLPPQLAQELQPFLIAFAPPYGPVRIYCRHCRRQGDPVLPNLAIYDHGRERWWRGRFPVLVPPPAAATVAPAHVESLAPEGGDLVAKTTLRLDLPAGLWAVLLHLPYGETGGFVVSHSEPQAALSLDGNRFTRSVTPFFSGETSVTGIIEHGGGPFFLSLLGDRAGLTVGSAVRLTLPVEDGDVALPMPPPSSWRPSRLTSDVRATAGGGMVVTGAPGGRGYLLLSPPFALPPQSDITIRLSLERRSGVPMVGVLNSLGGWRVLPQDPSQPLRLRTHGAEQATLVLVSEGAVGGRASSFELSQAIGRVRSLPERPFYGQVLADCAQGRGCP